MPKHIDRQTAAAVLNGLPSLFDAHLIERRLLRLHTEVVARELLEFRHTGDSLHQFSAHFAKWIDTEFRGHIRKTRKVVSQNLGGEQSQNQEWEKVGANVPIT